MSSETTIKCSKCGISAASHFFQPGHKQCKACRAEYYRAWRIQNKNALATYHKKYKAANRVRMAARDRKRRSEDPAFKLKMALRSRLVTVLKGAKRCGSAIRDLGCSAEELKIHIESQFTPGMTWANWSRDGWHIDHVKPLARFDLTDATQLREAVHFTNLRPMWAKENLSKGAR